MQGDYLVKATLAGGMARVLVGITTGLVEEARRVHDAWPTATAALGRTLTASALMAAVPDTGATVTLQLLGDGPVGRILAVAKPDGTVKGYLDNPQIHLPPNNLGKLDVAGAVGRRGMLYVVKDVGLEEPQRGTVPLTSGEIGLDLAEYYRRSEQIPAAIGLGVLVRADGGIQAAGGFLLHLSPDATGELSAELEKNLAAVTSVTDLVAGGWSAEKILAHLARGLPVAIKGRQPLRFHCGCSRERFSTPLLSLGRDELSTLLAEEEGLELRCHFCNSVYVFTPAEAKELLARARTAGK